MWIHLQLSDAKQDPGLIWNLKRYQTFKTNSFANGKFSWECERFAKDANVEEIAKSNIHIIGSKSLPNMRRGSETSSIVREMLETFAIFYFLFFYIPVETPVNNWQPPRMFDEFLEPKIWMLVFAFFFTFTSFTNRLHSRVKHTLTQVQMSLFVYVKNPCCIRVTVWALLLIHGHLSRQDLMSLNSRRNCFFGNEDWWFLKHDSKLDFKWQKIPK